MKMFLNTDKKYIDGNNPIPITLNEALTHINQQPTDETCEDNHIGFVNNKGETIQFIRFSDGYWLIDVPILKDGEYSHSLQDNDLDIVKVKEIVTRFSRDMNWRQLCKLTSTKPV